MQADIDAILFRSRYGVVALAIICWTCITGYMWLAVPFTDFGYRWKDDLLLQIRDLSTEATSAAQLSNGDIIISINGVRPNPRGHIYSLMHEESYRFTVDRAGELQNYTLSFPSWPDSNIAISYRLPSSILAFLLGLVGFFVFRYATNNDATAVRIGYIFVLVGLVVIGVQGYILGVPGAWLVGPPLLFPVSASILYISYLPRQEPLSHNVRTALQWAIVLGSLGALLGYAEGIVLLPNHSWSTVLGLSYYRTGMALVFLSVVFLGANLLRRWIQLPVSYERRQIAILAVFTGIGVLPAALLSFLPVLILNISILPLPIAIGLLSLCPAGYFYAYFRNDYLNLDSFFGRLAVLSVVGIAALSVYAVLFRAMQDLTTVQESIFVHLLLVFPLLVTIFLLNHPVSNQIQALLPGIPIASEQQKLLNILSGLSVRPERATLETIIGKVSADFSIPMMLLALSNQGVLTVVAQTNSGHKVGDELTASRLSSVVSRTHDPDHELFVSHPWAFLIVPVVLREVRIGYIALSQPKREGLNKPMFEFLLKLADIIAVGSETILLFETTRRRALEVVKAQERERRLLEGRLHDGPLQRLTYLNYDLQKVAHVLKHSDPDNVGCLDSVGVGLKMIADEIRQICIGLHPPAIKQGIVFITEDMANRFATDFGLRIETHVDTPDALNESPEVATAVYHILNESLNNVVKHARASMVRIEVNAADDLLHLRVIDDGKGIQDEYRSQTDSLHHEHLGINLMMTWAEVVRGNLTVTRHEPAGTCVELWAPVDSL